MKIEGNSHITGTQPIGASMERMNGGEVAPQIKKTEEASPVQENQTNNENFPGEKQLIDAIEKSNKGLKLNNTSLKFTIHEKTKSINVKIIDNTTKEVIREIPPEKILDMVAAMLERTGLFVDQKA